MAACHKGEGGGPNTGSREGLRDLIEQNINDDMQTFTANSFSAQQITGNHGTQVLLQPNAFRHGNGSPVTGAVQLQLLEVLTMADMIRFNKQTVGNDAGVYRLLRSGGAVYLNATQGGATLRIAPGSVTVRVPAANPDFNMELFAGRETQEGLMTWYPIDSSSITFPSDTSNFDPFYTFSVDSLEWINCDYFGSYPNTTVITATVPGAQPMDSTAAWIAFPTENAVMNLSASLTPQTFTSWQDVGVGLDAVVVALYRDGAQYYSAFHPITITSGMNVPLSFTPTTLAQFEAALAGL